MAYVDLSTLPIEHYLRNVPLADIGAECAYTTAHLGRVADMYHPSIPNRATKQAWKPVSSWRLSSASYNELGAAWTTNTEWRVRT